MKTIFIILIWFISCEGLNRSNQSETELIDESDYYDGEESAQNQNQNQNTHRPKESELQRRQHVLQRSPQTQQQQQQPQSQQYQQAYSNFYAQPTANVQPNPLRLPNVISLPPNAPARWVQPLGNGLPANPNVPAGAGTAQQRFILMPSPFTAATASPPPPNQKNTGQHVVTRIPLSAAATMSHQPPTSGQTWESVQTGSASFAGTAAASSGSAMTAPTGQRLIMLPNGKQSAGMTSNSGNVKLPRQQQPAYPQVPATGPAERPLYPQMVNVATMSPSPVAMSSGKTGPFSNYQTQNQQKQLLYLSTSRPQMLKNISEPTPEPEPQPEPESEAEDFEEEEEIPAQPQQSLTPAGRRIGVHTTHGRLLLEPHAENFCDLRQFSDEQLLSRNLQRVEYFVANLTCSRYFFECAIGQTFLLNCTSKDQVFDINTVNCNFKYNVKSCSEYDHILHCSIREECGQDHFACCAEPQQCIPYTKRCDGIADCGDGEDENNCPSCDPDEFPCVKSGKCISWDKRCNGIPDECFDETNLDELNCVGCPADKFLCGRPSELPLNQPPICIDPNLRCNGIRDCPRGEDELNCKSKGQKFLLCENQKQSVSKVQWCDGYEDCLDGSDEKYCVY